MSGGVAAPFFWVQLCSPGGSRSDLVIALALDLPRLQTPGAFIAGSQTRPPCVSRGADGGTWQENCSRGAQGSLTLVSVLLCGRLVCLGDVFAGNGVAGGEGTPSTLDAKSARLGLSLSDASCTGGCNPCCGACRGLSDGCQRLPEGAAIQGS